MMLVPIVTSLVSHPFVHTCPEHPYGSYRVDRRVGLLEEYEEGAVYGTLYVPQILPVVFNLMG